MKNYSIVRIGNEYVVQAGDKSMLKIASRRMAARLVTDATELLDSEPALPAQTLPEQTMPSIACDSSLDPSEVP